MPLCFNTTLVTVYHFNWFRNGRIGRVSIQPLLLFIIENTERMDMSCKFQYNPCYCLSQERTAVLIFWNRFNTTLVTVYRRVKLDQLTSTRSFNTTLVTVYLFKERYGLILVDEFQYNPCYCLSRTIHNSMYVSPVSIQPLLLFIAEWNWIS